MLLELECDAFVQTVNGAKVPRGRIVFHDGLNTILGDKKAENSIGKSTFLLVIDFCFGGSYYCDIKRCNVVSFVGHHTIRFAFKFGEKIERYSRDTLNHEVVKICDEKYNETGEEFSISDFQEHLRQAYGIEKAQNSWRSIVGRFARIYGRQNYDEKAPLTYGDETVANAIKALEQMYGVYDLIRSYEDFYAQKKKRKDVRSAGVAIGEITTIASTKKQVKQNIKELERLNAELAELLNNQDRSISSHETEQLDNAAKIKGQITALRRRRSRLLSQLAAVKANLNEGMIPTSDDLAELHEFFPTVALAKLETIELFHKKLQIILTSEMKNEIDRLELLISTATSELEQLENDKRALGVPTHVPKKFLQQVVELQKRIDLLSAQNKGYDDNKTLAAETSSAKTQMVDAREEQLAIIQTTINQEMVRLNDFIYGKKRYAPEISFTNTQTGNPAYVFGCKWNTGTGENYKNLIIFDLSVLSTTELPVLIHDSLIFKNIADLPIDKIMALYKQCPKQIFIAFDKQEAFDTFTSTTVAETKVIELYNGGGELFGWSWAEKPSESGSQEEIVTDETHETQGE